MTQTVKDGTEGNVASAGKPGRGIESVPQMEIPGLILNLLKPPGMTSHDVVEAVRHITEERRVGHAGTLDPAATGVLVVMTGPMVRLSPYLMAYDKRYRLDVTFGVATQTGDVQGQPTAQMDASGLTEKQVADALASLVGVVMMKPHRFSAAKVRGRKAYELAREGQEPELAERAVLIHEVTLVRFEPGVRARATIDVHCGKGTYVRSLAEMLGELVGLCAHASFVLRTHVGPMSVQDSVTLEELKEAAHAHRLAQVGLPVRVALAGHKHVTVSEEQARRLQAGTPVRMVAPGRLGDTVAIFGENGALIGMGEVRGGQPLVLQPRCILRT
ncbi:MAG: tRNA pseudouridine(55) synthase TruB [Armatimonadetes bacterium]|nr:tRNA pseudouridine(55) synthase TruB [Armatimonadota bacterium]